MSESARFTFELVDEGEVARHNVSRRRHAGPKTAVAVSIDCDRVGVYLICAASSGRVGSPTFRPRREALPSRPVAEPVHSTNIGSMPAFMDVAMMGDPEFAETAKAASTSPLARLAVREDPETAARAKRSRIGRAMTARYNFTQWPS